MKLHLFFLCLIAATTAYAQPELKGSPNELRQFLYPADNIVSIRASAEERAYSDVAVVSLTVTTKHQQLSQAIAANQQLRETVEQALQAAGVKAKFIKSSRFSSSPEYGWFGKKPSSFSVVNRIAVRIDETELLTAVAKLSDQYPELELSDMAFEHSKKSLFEKQVKAKAMKKILDQKAVYEQTLGVKLLPVAVRDGAIRQRASQGAAALQRRVAGNAYESAKKALVQTLSVPEAQPSSFDEVVYEANLAVDFKLQ